MCPHFFFFHETAAFSLKSVTVKKCAKKTNTTNNEFCMARTALTLDDLQTIPIVWHGGNKLQIFLIRMLTRCYTSVLVCSVFDMYTFVWEVRVTIIVVDVKITITHCRWFQILTFARDKRVLLIWTFTILTQTKYTLPYYVNNNIYIYILREISEEKSFHCRQLNGVRVLVVWGDCNRWQKSGI